MKSFAKQQMIRVIASVFVLAVMVAGIQAFTVGVRRGSELETAGAWNCESYDLLMERNGTVKLTNSGLAQEPATGVEVFVDGKLVKTFSAPKINSGQTITLGQVSVPSSGNFVWKLVAVKDRRCERTGNFTPVEIAQCTDTFSVPSSKCSEQCATDADCERGLTCVQNPVSQISNKICRKASNVRDVSCGDCVTCQTQIDVFWGPLIKSFAGGERYGTPLPRRLIRKFLLSDAPGCNLAPVTPETITIPNLPEGCKDPVGNKYLTAVISRPKLEAPNRYVTVTVKNSTTKCTYPVGAASYKGNSEFGESLGLSRQNIFDSKTDNIGPGQTKTFIIKVATLSGADSCYRIP